MVVPVELKEKPDSLSKTLATVKRNHPLRFVHSMEDAYEFKNTFDGFKLEGEWICVSHNDLEGYVFGGFLAKKPMIIPATYSNPLLDANMGDKISRKETTKIATIEGQKYDYPEILTVYTLGKRREVHFDGCIDIEYEFFQHSLSEVYMLMLSEFNDDIDFERTYYLGTKNEEYIFSGTEAVPEIRLKLRESRWVISYYSCS
jgi:hypothetical protein